MPKSETTSNGNSGESTVKRDLARILRSVGLNEESIPTSLRPGVVALAQEVIRLEEGIAKLNLAVTAAEELADYDPLCPVFNRRAFERELAREIAHCKRHRTELSMIYLDLDDFKQINDQHGHSVGDQVLIATSIHLKGSIRQTDILGRLGGDEFGIILPATTIEQASSRAHALEASISRLSVQSDNLGCTDRIIRGASTGTARWIQGQSATM
ncbi:MAG: GGDEF domain-containing protein, partial [Pseudomonadota bacterium]